MHKYVIVCFLLCLFDKAVCESLVSTNASWNGELKLTCSHDQSLIYVKEAQFGSMGENGRPACKIPVGGHVRNTCNGKKSCNLRVILGPFLDPKMVNCTTTPGLYVKHVCINKGASITDLTEVGKKWSGYAKPTDKQQGGYKSTRVTWKTINELCKTSPRFVQFELVDIDFVDNCDKEQLSVEVYQGEQRKTVTYCQKDLDTIPVASRVWSFANITRVNFVYDTKNRNPGNRGFLLKFIAMQCHPVPPIKNAVVEYSMSTDNKRVLTRIRCRENFFPMPGTPAEVTAKCDGNQCIYDCDYPSECNFGWKKEAHSGRMEDMKCVPPSALTTTVSTTLATTTTPEPSTSLTSPEASTSTSVAHITPPTTPDTANTTSSPDILQPTGKRGGRKPNNRQVLAGIIGGIVGIVGCLIVGILALMVCRKMRCPCCCIDSLLYDKASYAGSQAVSYADTTRTFGDSTLHLRYRPQSTVSTQVASNTLASVNRSSVGSSILFPSNRRSKRKTLPHPSTLGYGPYDETAPFFPEPASPRDVPPVFSPSVETYLEPDRRPSGPPPVPPQLSSFYPKSSSTQRGVYQVYDETRSSRNALDRFDAPTRPSDPRHSMALISNHYYCRGEGSDDDGKHSDSSVYEMVEDGIYSAGSTPCETRRHFPPAACNDYVQPPELPARPDRPATMRRSQQELPAAPMAACDDDVDENGYQPINCANRPV